MNKLTIIGNLTRDPQLRTVNGQNGPISVCDFTVAVNRRQRNGQNEADYFRVTAWRGLADNCQKYLAKGRKVAVFGPVSVSTYQGSDGVTRASLDVLAEDVEFLTPRQDGQQGGYQPQYQNPPQYQNAPQYQNPPQYQNASQQYQNAPQYQNGPAVTAQQPVQQSMEAQGYTEVVDDELPF